MKRKVLLPTDFSNNAWNAICYAIELYKNETCVFYILNAFSTVNYHLVEAFRTAKPGEKDYENAKSKSEKGLSKVLEMISFKDQDYPKHSFITISAFNTVLKAVKNIVAEKDIEIVVMGTKGETNAASVAFGTNAINVMEKARNCPVMVIPENTKNIAPKEIVFPTNYKTNFKRRELSYLVDLAKKSISTVIVLHVSPKNELDNTQINNKNSLEEYFQDINYSFHFLHKGHIGSAISIFAESRKSDMIAFINRKHLFFDSILTEPLVKYMGRDSKIPTLVMHDLRN